MPLVIPILYAVSTCLMVVMALVTAPVKTGMGLLIVICTAVPYYLLFVKHIVRISLLEDIASTYLLDSQAFKVVHCIL